MKGKLLVLGIAMALLASGFGLYQIFGGDMFTGGSSENEMRTVYAEACWLGDPHIGRVARNHSLIIVGKVEDRELGRVESPKIPHTKYTVRVLNVIKDSTGEEVKPGDAITVSQTGGFEKWGGEWYFTEFYDSPLMEEGSISVLFLGEGDDKDGIYWGLTPYTRFVVANGKVYSLDIVYPERVCVPSEEFHMEGEELGEFASMLKAREEEAIAWGIGRRYLENLREGIQIDDDIAKSELRTVDPNYYWHKRLGEEIEKPERENVTCWVVEFVLLENPNRHLQIWVDADSGEIVGGGISEAGRFLTDPEIPIF